MKFGGLLSCLKDLATGPSPEPDESNPHLYFPKIYSDIILPSMPPSQHFPSGFTAKLLYAFLASHPCHPP